MVQVLSLLQAQWHYDHHPEAGGEEEKLVNILQNPKSWVD
jgi:coproporphyrinogen III oxidase